MNENLAILVAFFDDQSPLIAAAVINLHLSNKGAGLCLLT